MRRPAVLLATAFLLGCAAGMAADLSNLALGAGILLCLLVYTAVRLCGTSCRPVFRLAPIYAALFLGGALRGNDWSGSAGSSAGPLPDPSYENYTGTIVSDPEWELRGHGRDVLHFELSLESGETVSAALYGGRREGLSYGDRVDVRARISGARRGRRHISGRLAKVVEAGADSIKRKLYGVRRGAADLLEFGIEDFPAESGILKALVLGYRRGVSRDARELFVATGSLHVFAISGLHVGIICAFLAFVLRSLRVPPTRWFPFLAVLLIGYTIMTGWSSSAVRACTMALVLYAGPFLLRKPDVISALFLSAVVLCLFSPAYLADIGFILSFAVTAGICILGGAMMARMAAIGEPDGFLPQSGARRHAAVNWALGAVAVSVSAWLVSAPLMLFFFGRLSTVGLLSNIVIVPISFLIVLSGCCSMVFGNVSLLLSGLFNHASLGLILLLEGVISFFARMPFGDFRDVHFGLLPVLAWYLLLAVLTAVLRGFVRRHPDLQKTA